MSVFEYLGPMTRNSTCLYQRLVWLLFITCNMSGDGFHPWIFGNVIILIYTPVKICCCGCILHYFYIFWNNRWRKELSTIQWYCAVHDAWNSFYSKPVGWKIISAMQKKKVQSSKSDNNMCSDFSLFSGS